MRVHHLNCGTMRPFGGNLINAAGSAFVSRMVCHCLLIETEQGLVLVDTGLGSHDVRAGAATLGRAWTWLTRPDLAYEETAAAQVARLGFRNDEVRHIVLTHLDLDHAGGLADFPRAKVHVLEAEYGAATAPGKAEAARYRPRQWAHDPDWVVHRADSGAPWFGFDAVRDLPGLPPEILLIPLAGHSRGHAGVAVRTSEGPWLLHAGDAFFSHQQMALSRPGVPPLLDAFEKIVQFDGTARRRNRDRLRALATQQSGEVEVFCAHDPVELDRYAAPSTP